MEDTEDLKKFDKRIDEDLLKKAMKKLTKTCFMLAMQ